MNKKILLAAVVAVLLAALLSFATFEGILHNHMYAFDGGIRHTATYALLDEQWPKAKAALTARLRD